MQEGTSASNRMCLTGIVFAVVMIQFVMRKCFLFGNLLLAATLPGAGWLRVLLLSPDEGLRSIYFAGLVAACALSCGVLLGVKGKEPETVLSHFLRGLLAFLTVVQLLLLPINYGVLIIGNTPMPRVAALSNQQNLTPGQAAWLIWEGKEGITYLIRNKGNQEPQKVLVTFPRKDINKIEIIAYDPILSTLFAP